jgi:hypothetical protein
MQNFAQWVRAANHVVEPQLPIFQVVGSQE